jgi:protein-tyrosine phosphatase
MTNFWEIEDIFKTVEGKFEWYEFMEKVDEKVTELDGHCDYETAAIIVTEEMKMNETVKTDTFHDIELEEGDCGIGCQISGTLSCGYCIHMSSFTPIEEICYSCRHLRTFICENCISESRYSPKKSEIDQEKEKTLLNNLRFVPASQSERIVFGARKPGHSINEVNEWIAVMKEQGIKRIICLLTEDQLNRYDGIDLLALYSEEFGKGNVCWAAIEDYNLCDEGKLIKTIIPFLMESDIMEKPVIVHCSGGSGRTGHILAAWLVFGRAFSISEALSSVKKIYRNPCEALECGNAKEEELYGLLKACQKFITQRIKRYNEFFSNRPNFTPHKGICWNCKCQIFYKYDGIEFITGCPYCSRSYCE